MLPLVQSYFHRVKSSVHDTAVWKYSLISLVVAGTILSIVSRVVIKGWLSTIFDFALPADEAASQAVGIAKIVASSLLFLYTLPTIATLVLTFSVFIQVFFVAAFLKSSNQVPPSTATNGRLGPLGSLGIYLKWTAVKTLMFIVLVPIFHVPLLGTVFHMAFTTVWMALLYHNLVRRCCPDGRGFFEAFRADFWDVFRISAVAMIISYAAIWIFGYFSVLISPFRPLFLLAIGAVVLFANFVLVAELANLLSRNRSGEAAAL